MEGCKEWWKSGNSVRFMFLLCCHVSGCFLLMHVQYMLRVLGMSFTVCDNTTTHKACLCLYSQRSSEEGRKAGCSSPHSLQTTSLSAYFFLSSQIFINSETDIQNTLFL